jgi:glycosyltransferase involved in cell wall biosynthesis
VDRADFIAGISQYTLDTAAKHLELGNKPRKVIYNGCNINDFPGYDSPVYRPAKPFLFSIGLVQPRKNFHLLPALLKDNDYELIIAGLNHFDYKTTVGEEARRWKVDHRVKLVGAISEEDKYWYYKNCTAFVFPSYAEGFGLPVIEAMYHGKPVFISKETSLPEIGGDAAYYFDSFDPEQMQETFKKGMLDYNQGDRVIKLKQRAAFFSWDKAAADYLEIYRSI